MVSGPYAAALVEWREAIGDIYEQIRSTHARDPRGSWERFRERRDFLYKHHKCSALTESSEKLTFTGFENYSYDPDLCFIARVEYEANGRSYDATR